jgi:hypothetical protein
MVGVLYRYCLAHKYYKRMEGAGKGKRTGAVFTILHFLHKLQIISIS